MITFRKIPLTYETLRKISDYVSDSGNKDYASIANPRGENWKDNSGFVHAIFRVDVLVNGIDIEDHAEEIENSVDFGLSHVAATSNGEAFTRYCQVRKLIFQDSVFRKNLLKREVVDLGLVTRTRCALRRAGIGTIGDLVKLNEEELLKLDNLGDVSLNCIKQRLADCYLQLQEN